MFKVAAVALGLAGVADLAAMVDELVGEGDPAVLGDDSHQFLLDLFSRLAFGQTEAAGDAVDMRVYHYSFCLAEADPKHHVGRLAGRAGDGDEFGEGLRDLAVVGFDDLLCRALNGFGFVVVETGGADQVFKFGQGRFRHCRWGREAAEEFGGDHVDADIGALGGEDGGYEKFPWGAVGEGALDGGVGFVEGFENGGDAVGGEVAALCAGFGLFLRGGFGCGHCVVFRLSMVEVRGLPPLHEKKRKDEAPAVVVRSAS